jgi:hypothetical protein
MELLNPIPISNRCLVNHPRLSAAFASGIPMAPMWTHPEFNIRTPEEEDWSIPGSTPGNASTTNPQRALCTTMSKLAFWMSNALDRKLSAADSRLKEN